MFRMQNSAGGIWIPSRRSVLPATSFPAPQFPGGKNLVSGRLEYALAAQPEVQGQGLAKGMAFNVEDPCMVVRHRLSNCAWYEPSYNGGERKLLTSNVKP
jgi:hypothetical protein